MRLLVVPLSIAIWVTTSTALAQPDPLIPVSEPIAGATQLEWSQRWWQWAFSFERVRSPIVDRNGAMCASRQSGEVWFLAGTYGSQRVERTCKVPTGKTLFFPLINYLAIRPEGTQEPCVSLAARAASPLEGPTNLVLELDGKRFSDLGSQRLRSPCFAIVPGGPVDAVSDGHFVAIRPLSRGTHVLNFGGVLPSMMQAVTYTLFVE